MAPVADPMDVGRLSAPARPASPPSPDLGDGAPGTPGTPDTQPLPITYFEDRLHRHGFERVAGVDEAGRGALAGPLVAAAVILPPDFDCPGAGLRDSKAMTPLQRDRCFDLVLERAVAVSVVKVTPARIDRDGLHRSNRSLLGRAVRSLALAPDFVLFDGFGPRRFGEFPALAVRKGDACAASVAAASVVAKVTRDRIMDRAHRRYPAYGFDHNRGYGTRGHYDVLNRLGPTPIHRLSFNGVGWVQLSLADKLREAWRASHNGAPEEDAHER